MTTLADRPGRTPATPSPADRSATASPTLNSPSSKPSDPEPPAPTSSTPRAAGWSLRKRLGRTGLALVALVLALIVVIGVTVSQFVLAGNQVIYRWQPAQLASQQVLNDLVNQETGLRGYSLTYNRANLQPYLEYSSREVDDRRHLENLVGDDPAIRALVTRFETRADHWYRDYARPVIADLDAGLRAGIDESDAGRAQFDRIRAAAARLDDAVARRADQAQRNRTVLGGVAVGAFGLGVLVVFLAGFLLWRGLGRWVLAPVDALGAQTRRTVAGDLDRPIEPAGPQELVELGEDVEAMRARITAELARVERIGEDLRRKGAELERSNADLQQFAYVASHDLSEPLRKVANFCQLLERQYGDQLDDRARQYIGFAVDGAKRMQALITDLLALSRVGRNTDSFVELDLNAVLEQVRHNLAEPMRRTGAHVELVGSLPTVRGDRSLLASLLQNLIGNAVKYHREDVAPHIEIGAEHTGTEWTITVRDNGIGIDPQYAERIFAVFQRLHLRDQYGGTGIGLALCRRIVEFHGGRVWLDTAPLEHPGSTFVLTLPESSPRAEHLD